MNNYCIISHQHKFIYIPIAKVACTTFLNRVAEIIHGKSINEIKTIKISSHRDVHSQRKKIFNTNNSEIMSNTEKALSDYQDYFKFAFVRNPFARVQSCYIDKISMDSYGFDTNLIKNFSKIYRGMTFKEFLRAIEDLDPRDMDEHFRPQYTFFNKDEVDYIGKVERIDEDWTEIEKIILKKNTIDTLPVFNKTQRNDYYDSHAEELVKRIYHKDFKLFNYPKEHKYEKNKLSELPIFISASAKQNIFPFKDIILKNKGDVYEVIVTGGDPILIIPFFNVEKDTHIALHGEIFSPINTVLTVYYTTRNALESPHSNHRDMYLKRGINNIKIILDDDNIVGRLRLKISKKKGVFKIKNIEIFKHTPPWNEDPDELTEINRHLFSLPNYVQKKKNLFSMCNFASLFMPILNIIKPGEICEIGSDQGNNTYLLAKYCSEKKAQLVIVDPCEVDRNIFEFKTEITIVNKKSVDYLKYQVKPSDVYFIDGDHNYKTVFKELEMIDSLANNSENPVCIFLHDVSWPWAYRNLYYSPEEEGIDADTYNRDSGVSLYSTKPKEDGLPSNMNYAFSVTEGGCENGVRKALEDFLKTHEQWRSVEIHSLYGLGILWTESKMNEKQKKVFEEIESHFKFFKEFLSILEWNRIALYCQINKNARMWRSDKAYIKRLEQLYNPKNIFKNIQYFLNKKYRS